MKTAGKPRCILAWQLRPDALPDALRALEVICLFSQFVPYWEGPSPLNLRRVGAFTVYSEVKRIKPGITFWFFLPDDRQDAALSLALMQSASLQMLPWASQRAEAACATYLSRAVIERPPKRLDNSTEASFGDWQERMETTRRESQRLREEAQYLMQRAKLVLDKTKQTSATIKRLE